MNQIWSELNYKKKLYSITIGVFVLLVASLFVFNRGLYFMPNNKIETPDNWPEDADGVWNVYLYKGNGQEKLIPYPPKWTVTETLPIKFIPPNSVNENDYIGIGSGDCSTIKIIPCVGNEPIYTLSREGRILVVFDKMVKNIIKYKKE